MSRDTLRDPSTETPDSTTEPNIPYKKDGELKNSSISQDPDGKIRVSTEIIAEAGIDTIQGTITLGDGVDIKASGPSQINVSKVTGSFFQIPYQQFDKNGSIKISTVESIAEDHESRQTVFDTQLTSPLVVNIVVPKFEILNAIYIRTDGDVDNFRFQVKSIDTGEIVDRYPDKYHFARGEGISLIGAGIHKIDFYFTEHSTPPRFAQGQQLEYSLLWESGGGALLGTGVSTAAGTFVSGGGFPFYEVDIQEFELVDLVNAGDPISVLEGADDLMDKTTYDPNTVEGDAFDMDNMVESATKKVLTVAERDKIASLTGGRYLGVFADLAALQTAYPTGVTGDSATVTSPDGNLFYWNVTVWADSGTGFLGDMLASNYDPTNKQSDVYSMDNMDETATKKVLTSTERSAISTNTSKVSFPEAPEDGKQYARKDADWEEVAAASAADMEKSVYDTDNSGVVDNSEGLEGNDSTYHLDRANHSGSQAASTISDFDTEVSNNTDVEANKTHSEVVVGNPHAVTKAEVGLSNVANAEQIPLIQKDAANGVPGLDSAIRVKEEQLPLVAMKLETQRRL